MTPRLPGDPIGKDLIDRILRVDHAGEYGARRIYEGQLSVLGKSACGPTLRHMAEQEALHLKTFEKLVVERWARPTALLPIWHVAGYALGAATALLGEARDAELMVHDLPEPPAGSPLQVPARRLRLAAMRHRARCLRAARMQGTVAMREGRGEVRRRVRGALDPAR